MVNEIYAANEAIANTQLQEHIDRESGPLKQELGLARWQLAQIVAMGSAPALMRDFILLVARLEKDNVAALKIVGELWSREQRERFLHQLEAAIVAELEDLPDWQNRVCRIADKWIEAAASEQRAASAPRVGYMPPEREDE